VEQDRADVHEPGDDLPRRDRGALRAVAVLELPSAERHPVEEVEALLHAHDLGRRPGPRLLFRQEAPLRLVREALLLAEHAPALAQRRERGLVLALHAIEELDDRRRDEERVEGVVRVVREQVHERGASLRLVAELELGDAEHPVRVHGLVVGELRVGREEAAEGPGRVRVLTELEAVLRALEVRRRREDEGDQEGDQGWASLDGAATMTSPPARSFTWTSRGGAPATSRPIFAGPSYGLSPAGTATANDVRWDSPAVPTNRPST
jgi:hypothetical protein